MPTENIDFTRIRDVLGNLADCPHGMDNNFRTWTTSRNGYTYCLLCEEKLLKDQIKQLQTEISMLRLILSENDIEVGYE